METIAPEKKMPEVTGMPSLSFKVFPGFARFIREQHLVSYIQKQIDLSRELDLPILKYVQHIPDDQLIEMGRQSHIDFLNGVESGTLDDFLQKSLKQWEDDQLGIVSRHDIAAEDMTVGTHVRKRILQKFIPLYTTDPLEILALVDEIETYGVVFSTASVNMYIKILRNRIEEHAHFIESVTNTTPGAIYVFSIAENREIYSNRKTAELIGYSKEEIKEMDTALLATIVHPHDQERLFENHKEFLTLEPGQINTIDIRVKHKAGHYVWLRNHRSVFKRDKHGAPTQIIGITLNVNEEKENETRLKKSEEQLLEAQELANMGSYIWNIETNELHVTPQFRKIYESDSGYRDEIAKHVHPADVDRIDAERQKAIDEGGVYDTEYRYVINGKEKVIWARGAVYYQNGVKMMKGTVMDVTERKHMIQTLQRSEGLYKQAQAMAHIGNWAWDLKFNKLTWSDEMYRIYGLEPGIPIDNNAIRRMNHPDDDAIVKGSIDRALETLEPYDFYYRIITADGMQKIVQATGNVLVGGDGKPYKMTGTVQDVTERQQLIENLQKSKERYKQAQAMAHIGNWEWYISDNRMVWTDELYRIYGLDPKQDEVSYDGYFAMIHPDDKDIMKLAIQNCLNHQKSFDVNHRIVLGSGKIKYIRAIGDVAVDNSGEAIKLFGTAQDITAQKEYEQAMQQKNVELAYSNASLEEFAYVASHDLKEPLRKISTFGDLMLNAEKDKLSPEGKNYLDKIISSSKRMQTMINDLMALSTISGNKSFEPSDLNNILSEVIGTLEYAIREKSAIINSEQLPVISVVPSQFRQLFQNLVSNAIKFAKPGVSPVINISSSWLPSADVARYGLMQRKPYLKIEFSDNGIGFENEYANKIFTIFQRLHGKSEYEGNGIGLSICRKVVENHKGIIQATGDPGKGSVFTIIIPAEQSEQ